MKRIDLTTKPEVITAEEAFYYYDRTGANYNSDAFEAALESIYDLFAPMGYEWDYIDEVFYYIGNKDEGALWGDWDAGNNDGLHIKMALTSEEVHNGARLVKKKGKWGRM